MHVRVKVRCVGCKSERSVGPDGAQPFCDECGSPMVAISASAELEADAPRGVEQMRYQRALATEQQA